MNYRSMLLSKTREIFNEWVKLKHHGVTTDQRHLRLFISFLIFNFLDFSWNYFFTFFEKEIISLLYYTTLIIKCRLINWMLLHRKVASRATRSFLPNLIGQWRAGSIPVFFFPLFLSFPVAGKRGYHVKNKSSKILKLQLIIYLNSISYLYKKI